MRHEATYTEEFGSMPEALAWVASVLSDFTDDVRVQVHPLHVLSNMSGAEWVTSVEAVVCGPVKPRVPKQPVKQGPPVHLTYHEGEKQ